MDLKYTLQHSENAGFCNLPCSRELLLQNEDTVAKLIKLTQIILQKKVSRGKRKPYLPPSATLCSSSSLVSLKKQKFKVKND